MTNPVPAGDMDDPLKLLEDTSAADAARAAREEEYHRWWSDRLPDKATVMQAVCTLGEFASYDDPDAVQAWGRETLAAAENIRQFQLEPLLAPQEWDSRARIMAKAALRAALKDWVEAAIRAARAIVRP